MQLSGKEVSELFDFVARRSTGRGCTSQVQIAGARVVLDCVAQSEGNPPGVATNIYIGPVDPKIDCGADADCPGGALGSCDLNTQRCWQSIDEIASYELATSNYLAGGGSGFRVLQRNTTQFDTKIQQRDALIDYIRGGRACGSKADGELTSCQTDADCVRDVGDGFVCACRESAIEGEVCTTDPASTCSLASGEPGPEDGACVLARCRDDVASFQRALCDRSPTQEGREQCLAAADPCATGGEQCKFLACLDATLGNVSDGRVRMVGK
jgi:5'-nucleotidase